MKLFLLIPFLLVSGSNIDETTIEQTDIQIAAPAMQQSKMERQPIDAALESNFHKALDARYAVSEGIMYAAPISTR